MSRWFVSLWAGGADLVEAHTVRLEQGALVFFEEDPAPNEPLRVSRIYGPGAWSRLNRTEVST